MHKHAIILPLKESFTLENSGAVSIWVDDYVESSKFKKNIFIIANKKLSNHQNYLRKKNLITVGIKDKFRKNIKYIYEISKIILKKKIKSVEIHNRPEYAAYLINKFPEIKVNLIFHNDPNTIRGSKTYNDKVFLVKNCNNIVFVSNFLKKIFYRHLKIDHKNNIHVIYNSVKKSNKIKNKKKLITFTGKLNRSKGYPIFLDAIKKILNKFNDWKVEVYGNEPREKYPFSHERFKCSDWIPHKKILKIYESASINVVNPTWQEPFGRTAMESASKGCAVITSNSGGLCETFKNNLVLKSNNARSLENMIKKLIINKKLLKKIQLYNIKNPLNLREKNVKQLDKLNFFNTNNIQKFSKNYKILHVSTFGEKINHRTFNISIAKKISTGLIRNNNDVIDFDCRNYNSNFMESLDEKILNICKNYRPDLVLFGHNNVLTRSSLREIKFYSKIAIWFEDHVMKGDPSFKKNLTLLEKNHDLIDKFFITTSPDVIKTKIPINKIHFLPIPADPNIEKYEFYKEEKNKDIFFALSHGVNYGKLKKNNTDERENFIKKIIKYSEEKIKFALLGYNNEEPKWNYDYFNELKRSKMALNLSRGGPSKYCTSNRISTLVANGVPTFVRSQIKWNDFFSNKEMIFFNNPKDLIEKILYYKYRKKDLYKIGKMGKRKYFKIFNNKIVADYIICKIFDKKSKFKFIWDK